MDRVYKVTERLIDDDLLGFRSMRKCVDQIFTLKELGKKHKRINREYM